MNLVCAIVPHAIVKQILDALTTAGYRATRVSTTGGFLHHGNSTLLIGVEQQQLEAVLRLIRGESLGEDEGGATVFVLGVEQFGHT